ncbi:MAG: quinone oxidoreductase [Candidatus Entotheonella factor]|uniref:Quinone oxidoreductase n=3 Tax=Candidatus Entotheonella TaxID=93171 RepID=W4LQW3_ENTF1|nr:MAG: quinone oxidoreductase [Candidatus Entotheonella factor]
MKAVRIHEFGGPEAMQYEEVPTPTPAAGQVLVKLAAAGLNFIDVYQRTGLYPNALPYTLGLEGSGTVEAVGPEVTGFSPGDPVAYTGVPGSYADYVLVPADRLVHMPESLDIKYGAAAMLQGMTAHYLAYTTYPLQAGDTCLVHAAAGGVGLLLVQMAKQCGARVIGTVSTEEKAALAREAGADEMILYTQQDFEAEVKRLTDGRGVQVIYDSVAKDTFDKGLNCLAPLGYMVLYGQSSGPIPPFNPAILNEKGSLFLTRPSLFHYIADRASLEKRAGDVLGWLASGQLKLRMEHTFDLKDVAESHRSLEGRKTTGKVLLIP